MYLYGQAFSLCPLCDAWTIASQRLAGRKFDYFCFDEFPAAEHHKRAELPIENSICYADSQMET